MPLWALMPDADLQDTAALISCNQDIAADGAFSLGMLADLDRNLVEDGPWAYRRLYWECGVIRAYWHDDWSLDGKAFQRPS